MRGVVSILLMALLTVGGIFPYVQCDAVISAEASNHSRPHLHLNGEGHSHGHAGQTSECVTHCHDENPRTVADRLSVPRANFSTAASPMADHSCGLLVIADQTSDVRRSQVDCPILVMSCWVIVPGVELGLTHSQNATQVDLSHRIDSAMSRQRNFILRI